jgi:hypothetical protein
MSRDHEWAGCKLGPLSLRITSNDGEVSATPLRVELAFVARLLERTKMRVFRSRDLPLDPHAA